MLWQIIRAINHNMNFMLIYLGDSLDAGALFFFLNGNWLMYCSKVNLDDLLDDKFLLSLLRLIRSEMTKIIFFFILSMYPSCDLGSRTSACFFLPLLLRCLFYRILVLEFHTRTVPFHILQFSGLPNFFFLFFGIHWPKLTENGLQKKSSLPWKIIYDNSGP